MERVQTPLLPIPSLLLPGLSLAVNHPGGTGHQEVLGSVARKGWVGFSAVLLPTGPLS